MSSGPGIASKDRENVVANTTKNRDKDSISSAAASAKDSKTSNFTTLNINSLYRGKSIETSKAPVQKHGMQSLGKVGNIRRLAAPNSSQSSSSLSTLKSHPESGQENSKLVESASVSGGADTTNTTNINTSSSWTNQPQQQNTNFTSVNNKSRDSAKSTQDSTSLLKQGSGGIFSQYPQSSGGGGTRWISPAVGPASAFPPLGAEPPPAVPSPKQNLVTTNPLSLPPTEFPELGAEPLSKEDPTKGGATGQVERSQGLPPPISIPTAPASQREQETPAYGPGPSLRPSVKWNQGAAPPVVNGQLPIPPINVNSADGTRAFAGLPPPTLNVTLLPPTRGPQYCSSQRSGYHGGGGDGGTLSPRLSSRTGKGGKENESTAQPPKFSSANIIPSEKISAFDEILEKGGELKIDWTTACCEIDYEEELKFDLDDGESLFLTKKSPPKLVTSTVTSSNTTSTLSKCGPERERTISETSNGTQGGRGAPIRHASFEDEVTRGQLNPSHRVLYDPRDGKQKPAPNLGGKPRRDSRSTSERSDEDVAYEKNQIGGGKHGEVPRSQGLPPPPGVVPFTTNVINEPRNRTIAPRFQKSQQQQIHPRYDTGPNRPLNRNVPNDGRVLKESQGISSAGQGQQNQNERRPTLSRAEEDPNWRISRNKPKPDGSSTRKLSVGDKESTTGNVVREILKPESRVESAKNTEKQQPSNDQQLLSHNMTTLGTRKLNSQQQQGENLTQSGNNIKSRTDDSSSRKWNEARRSSRDSGHSGSTEKKTDGPFSSISTDTLKQPEKSLCALPTNTTSVPPGLSKDSTVPPARIVIGLHGSTTGPVRINSTASGSLRVISTSNYGPPPSTAAFVNVQPVKATNLLDDSSKSGQQPLGSSNRDGERSGLNQQPRNHNQEHDYPSRDQDRQYQHRDNDSRYRDDRRQNEQPRNENKQTSSLQQNRPQPPSLSEARSAKSPDDDEYETASESSHKDLDVKTDAKSQNRLQQHASKGNNNIRQVNNNDRPRDERKEGPSSRPSGERRRREGAESNRPDDRTRNDRQKKPDERRKQDAVKDIVNSLNEVSLSEKNSVTGLKKDFNSLTTSEKKAAKGEDYDLTDGHKRRPKEVEDTTTADSKKLKQEKSSSSNNKNRTSKDNRYERDHRRRDPKSEEKLEKLSDIAFSAKGDGDSSNLWSNKQTTTVSHVSSKPGMSKLDAGVGLIDPQRPSANVGEKKPAPSGPFSSIQAVKGSPATTVSSSGEPVGTLIIENSNFRKGQQGPQQQQPFERRSVGRDSLSSGPSPFDKNCTSANYSSLDDKNRFAVKQQQHLENQSRSTSRDSMSWGQSQAQELDQKIQSVKKVWDEPSATPMDGSRSSPVRNPPHPNVGPPPGHPATISKGYSPQQPQHVHQIKSGGHPLQVPYQRSLSGESNVNHQVSSPPLDVQQQQQIAGGHFGQPIQQSATSGSGGVHPGSVSSPPMFTPQQHQQMTAMAASIANHAQSMFSSQAFPPQLQAFAQQVAQSHLANFATGHHAFGHQLLQQQQQQHASRVAAMQQQQMTFGASSGQAATGGLPDYRGVSQHPSSFSHQTTSAHGPIGPAHLVQTAVTTAQQMMKTQQQQQFMMHHHHHQQAAAAHAFAARGFFPPGMDNSTNHGGGGGPPPGHSTSLNNPQLQQQRAAAVAAVGAVIRGNNPNFNSNNDPRSRSGGGQRPF